MLWSDTTQRVFFDKQIWIVPVTQSVSFSGIKYTGHAL